VDIGPTSPDDPPDGLAEPQLLGGKLHALRFIDWGATARR
jgi:hypothetical protein